MNKVVLTVTYNGKNFCGWQTQPQKRSVQECIENALFCILGQKVSVCASGRTDAGVHALGQVAHFETEKDINIKTIASSINAHLPEDVKIINATFGEPDFDARFCAKQKTYIYKFYVNRFELPLKLERELRVNDNIDINLMQQALKYLIGEHDFKSFVSKKSGKTNFVRTIYDAKINKIADSDYEFEITGNGFLYNMVRIIMGTLIEIGLKKKIPEDLKTIIDGESRALAGKTAPAYALYLKEVRYN